MNFKDKFYKIINTEIFNYCSNIGLVYFYIFLALLIIAVCFIKYMNVLGWFYLIFISYVLIPMSILLVVIIPIILLIETILKEDKKENLQILKPSKVMHKCLGFIIYLMIFVVNIFMFFAMVLIKMKIK
ncbi:unknown [Clostridium sp. CAG:715]|nr:unknown [Clostridium sp. CAG:715]